MSWKDIVRKGDCDCEDCRKKRFEKQLFEKKGAKPDYIDLDKDGNTTESMKEAAKDAKERGINMTRCSYLDSWFDFQSKKIDEKERKTKKCFATGGKKNELVEHH